MAMTTCPVCGMEFPEEDAAGLGAFPVAVEGKTYWCCSSTCRDAFQKDPQKFLARAS